MRFHFFISEFVLFAGALLLGVCVASSSSIAGIPAPEKQLAFSWASTVGAIAIVIGVLFAIRRFPRMRTGVLLFFLSLTVLVGGDVVFRSFLAPDQAMFASFFLLGLMLLARTVLMHNIAMIVSIVGVAVMIGVGIQAHLVIVLLAVFSVYDILAVYWTKHMVAMARGMIESGVVFGFVVPATPRGFFQKRSAIPSGMGEQYMILGSGDVGLPLILIASVATSSASAASALVGFACAGLLLTHILFISQRTRQAMAALPPIAVSTILGYLILGL